MYSEYDDEQEEYDENQNSQSTISQSMPGKKLLIIIVIIEILVILGLLIFKHKSVTIELEENPIYIKINDSKKINIKVGGEIYNGNFNNVNLKIDNSSLVSIGDNGILKADNYPGSTNITITYNDNGKTYGGKGIINVYLGEKGVNLEDFNFPSLELRMKPSTTFELIKKFEFNPLNGYVESIEYINSNPAIIKVDEKGNIDALTLGESEITVVVNGNLRRKFKVVVTNEDSNLGFNDDKENTEEIKIEKITFNQPEIQISSTAATLNMKKNDVFNLIPEITPTNAANKELSFEVQDKDILSINVSPSKTSASITALKSGTTTITIKSTNNIIAILTVIVSGSDSSPSPTYNCYCNSSNKCVWKTGKSNDYINKQSQIPNSTACDVYSNNNSQACFTNSKGEYFWGKYGNTSGYSYVSGVSSVSTCKKNVTSKDSLSCPSINKGNSGQCSLATTTSSKIKTVKSSNDNIVKIVSHSDNKIDFKCLNDQQKGIKTASITAELSSGKTVTASVNCKDSNSSIYLSCNLLYPEKNKEVSCKVNGINSASELASCSSTLGNFRKDGANCVGTYNGVGKVTVTAKTTSGQSTSQDITFKDGNKSIIVNCNTKTPKIGSTVTCSVSGTTNIKCTASDGLNCPCVGGVCTVTYNGSTEKKVTLTFTASDAPNAIRVITFTKEDSKELTVSCNQPVGNVAKCTVKTNADSFNCIANNNAICICHGENCSISYNGGKKNQQVIVTFTISEVITATGGKSKTVPITFNSQ